jgi:hypothetical protein|tara:strand:+ start:1705 stop:1986 length:282 start_codon:yes stop_codon:yes gene_type:complete
MISDKDIYAISGRDLKQFIHMISDLKDIAIEYTEKSDLDVRETELCFDTFINNLLHSPIFKNVSVLDLQDEFSFYELLKSTGLFTKTWGNKKF